MELDISARGQKTRMIWLRGRERSLTISSAVWIQSTNVTDRRTPDDRKNRAYHIRIASRIRNELYKFFRDERHRFWSENFSVLDRDGMTFDQKETGCNLREYT